MRAPFAASPAFPCTPPTVPAPPVAFCVIAAICASELASAKFKDLAVAEVRPEVAAAERLLLNTAGLFWPNTIGPPNGAMPNGAGILAVPLAGPGKPVVGAEPGVAGF